MAVAMLITVVIAMAAPLVAVIVPIASIAMVVSAPSIAMVFTPASVLSAVAVAITVLFTVAWCVDVVVPVVPHKIDFPTAGIVFATMLAPVFGMAWRDAQIDWALMHISRFTHNDNRLGVKQLRAGVGVADVDLAIKAGLADTDRDADISGERRGGC